MTVPDLIHFLTVHARWAANSHPAFSEFAADMRDLRATLEAATSRTRRPTKAGAQCFACGSPLVRRVVESTVTAQIRSGESVERTGQLEEDHVTCTACREQYDPARYTLALKAAAEDAAWITRDGEQWATHAAMAGELGRSETTIRVWVHRGLVRQRSVERVLFVSVADCRARDERRAG